jgi:hypothetical protein
MRNRVTCSRRSTAGSPKASTYPILKPQRSRSRSQNVRAVRSRWPDRFENRSSGHIMRASECALRSAPELLKPPMELAFCTTTISMVRVVRAQNLAALALRRQIHRLYADLPRRRGRSRGADPSRRATRRPPRISRSRTSSSGTVSAVATTWSAAMCRPTCAPRGAMVATSA